MRKIHVLDPRTFEEFLVSPEQFAEAFAVAEADKAREPPGTDRRGTVSIPTAIIAEAILSFLGLGVQPPRPNWGTMLNTAQQFLDSAPWMAWWPGLAIFTLTLSFNLAGDGLRDWLDPRD